jgi:hypothetical protein
MSVESTHEPLEPQTFDAQSPSDPQLAHPFDAQIGAAGEQSAFVTHWTHTFALQTGVGAAQSPFITHCTHEPFEQIASAALPPNPGHSMFDSHVASHSCELEQNGSCALQSVLLEHVSATHEFAMHTSPSEHI